jgi:SSU ribosomal protein S5P
MANNDQKRDEGYIEKLVQVNRVAKTVKGGRIFTFTALTVVVMARVALVSAVASRAKYLLRSRKPWKLLVAT